jgi:tetratricopeptide (TPR) repeat protein
MTHLFWITGNQDRAVESGQRALTLATEIGDFDLEVLANFYVGVAYHAMSHYDRATTFFARTRASLHGDLVHKPFGLAGLPSVMSRGLLVWCLAELGRFAERIGPAREALEIGQESDQSYSLISACFCVGFGHLRKGELDHAIALLERALRLIRERNVPVLLPWAASPLGYAYALSGRTGKAVALLAEAVERSRSMKSQLLNALWLSWLSEAYLRADQRHDAIECAHRALEIARDRAEQGHEAHVLYVLGEIAVQSDTMSLEAAERYYRQAIGLAGELGMRPLVAHCHLGLGKLYRRTGDRGQAQEHLATATTMYREMEMRFWLEKVEAEMSELG